MDMKRISAAVRLKVLELSHHGRSAHIGSCLSVVDILVAAYCGGLNITPENVGSLDRDRLIFGKGHAAAALLAVLMEQGFVSRDMVFREFNQPGGCLQEHPGPSWPRGGGIAAGSLGHALPIASGLAMASVAQDRKFRVCAVIGDGECNEGTVWEAAMFAGGQGLANLCVVVDANGWQGTGRCREISASEPMADKWKAFGWRVVELDGHNGEELLDALQSFGGGNRPTAIIARTVKGKGVSFMEDDNNWHYRLLSKEDLALAAKEIGA